MSPRLMDVTLREAVLVDGCAFVAPTAADIVRSLDQAGIEFIEVGYVDGNPANSKSAAGTCPPWYLDLMRRNIRRAGMCVMVHADKTDTAVYSRLRRQGVDVVRFIAVPSNISTVLPHAHICRELGLQVSLNLIRTTKHCAEDLVTAAAHARAVGADFLYLADSNGSLHPNRLRHWCRLLSPGDDYVLGFHGHDNLSLAFANSLVALDEGVGLLDASLGGLGKGGGNLSTELIAAYLHRECHGDYDVLRLASLSAQHTNVGTTKRFWDRFHDHLSGLLDLNVDARASITAEATRGNVPLEARLVDELTSATPRPPLRADPEPVTPAPPCAPGVDALDAFIEELQAMIAARRKMSSPLYQLILAGGASRTLLQQFVIHRFPIKNLWSRNILGIASRLDDYTLRSKLVENIYEEETGRLSSSVRHLDSFIAFGEHLGLRYDEIVCAEIRPKTRAIMNHNLHACNNPDVHFTEGVASVLLLMEGQPPITNGDRQSMETVMRDCYGLPEAGYAFFTHHASHIEGAGPSALEDDHADTAREILRRYCTSPVAMRRARLSLQHAIELRHRHFDAIYNDYADRSAEPFRYRSGRAA